MSKLMVSLFMLFISLPAAMAGDLAQTCDAMALQQDWACDSSFVSSDMQLFCRANVMMDADQNLICPKIQSADLRHFCNSSSQVEPAECALIQNADMKNTCLAIAQADGSLCGLVTDPDLKHFCDAVAGAKSAECAAINN